MPAAAPDRRTPDPADAVAPTSGRPRTRRRRGAGATEGPDRGGSPPAPSGSAWWAGMHPGPRAPGGEPSGGVRSGRELSVGEPLAGPTEMARSSRHHLTIG